MKVLTYNNKVAMLPNSKVAKHTDLHYKYYERPDNFPDWDNFDFANFPSASNPYRNYCVFLKGEIIGDFNVYTGGSAVYLYSYVNGVFTLIHTFVDSTTSTTGRVAIKKSVIDSFDNEIFVLAAYANSRSENNIYFNWSSVDVHYNMSLGSNSASFQADRKGFAGFLTEYFLCVNCSCGNPMAAYSNGRVKKIKFVNCTFTTTDAHYMFIGCTAKEITFENCTFNLSGTLTSAMQNMYFLESIDLSGIDFSGFTSSGHLLRGCYSLQNLSSINIPVSFNLSDSILLTHDSLMNVINGLPTVATTQTLTLGSTLQAKLTAEEMAIATGKGWTLA